MSFLLGYVLGVSTVGLAIFLACCMDTPDDDEYGDASFG